MPPSASDPPAPPTDTYLPYRDLSSVGDSSALPAALAPSPPAGSTVARALAWATATLREAGVPSPDLDGLLLLGASLNMSKASLLAHPERVLTPAETDYLRALVARRAQRIPLAYVLGTREFYGRDFAVTPAVLIPRPETELLVELALEHQGHAIPNWAADVGTGSGALAVTLAAERPAWQVVATDRSPAALAVAAANAARHGVAARVSSVCADLLAPIVGPLDLVVANLPYIPADDIDGLMPEVARHEPRLALDGGPDGLALIRRLLAQAATCLAPGGLLLLEMGADQGPALRAEAARLLPHADLAIHKDLAGLDRVLRVQIPAD